MSRLAPGPSRRSRSRSTSISRPDSVGLAQEDTANAIGCGARSIGAGAGSSGSSSPPRARPGSPCRARQVSGLQGGASGRVRLASKASDRSRPLPQPPSACRAPFLQVLDGRPFEAASDSRRRPARSPRLRNLRVKAGDATLRTRQSAVHGAGRGCPRQAGSAGGRAGPQSRPAPAGLRKRVRRHPEPRCRLHSRRARRAGPETNAGAGRSPRGSSPTDRPSCVEALDIVDLAGANARVSGRIAPTGRAASPARSRPSGPRPSWISWAASGSAACPRSLVPALPAGRRSQPRHRHGARGAEARRLRP